VVATDEAAQQSEQAEQPVRIATGTLNSTKVAAIEMAAESFFPAVAVEAVEVHSGVPAQPLGDEQTALGALHRAAQAQRIREADYGIGIESGVVEGPGNRLYVVSWAAAIDRLGRVSYGGSERFALPPEVAEQVQLGRELGPVLERLVEAGAQLRLQGAAAVMSGGRRDRISLHVIAVTHALAGLIVKWRLR